jgi:radical SAM protein with 4Fe4S-binding SPASM domain
MKQLSRNDFEDRLLPRICRTRTPETAVFELTYGCNLRCLHCSNPTHKALQNELTTTEILNLLDQSADLGILTVTFTGGELLTRPDVFTLFDHAATQGFVLEMISNATRVTPELASRLRALPFKNICFSIYGATEGTYEQVTQQPHSFTHFLDGLATAAEHHLPVSAIRMPVLSLNAHEVLDAKALVESYGFKFQSCMEIFPRTNGNLDPLRYRLSPEEKIRVGQTLWENPIEAVPDPSCRSTTPFIECACGQTRFAITPYGEMNLCTGFPIPRYNLRTGTLREGWEVLKATVDRASETRHDDCPSCAVRSTCQQKRNHAWLETGDMNACLPHYKAWATLEQQAYVSIDPRQSR